MKKVLILTGEGIECEKESARFFKEESFQLGVEMLPVPKLLRREIKISEIANKGDLIFLPGGFSFADHFGSGKLLSFKLRSSGFFDEALKSGLHFMGVCNGFQVLTEAKLFGESVSLNANEVNSKRLGFINRWVECAGLGPLKGQEIFRLPVRHGEGRLERKLSRWETGVEPILSYVDSDFDNGSVERVAGLIARHGESVIIGMMPHPEIALRLLDHPDVSGPESGALHRSKANEKSGDGLRLMRTLLMSIGDKHVA